MLTTKGNHDTNYTLSKTLSAPFFFYKDFGSPGNLTFFPSAPLLRSFLVCFFLFIKKVTRGEAAKLQFFFLKRENGGLRSPSAIARLHRKITQFRLSPFLNALV